MDRRWILYALLVLYCCASGLLGLQCWHCIADNCDMEPADNYKALKKACNTGQSCQKVFFQMYDETVRQKYTSTIRGCSAGCKLKNDFANCTHELLTSRGCVRKDCCHDNDLCNGSDDKRVPLRLPVCLMASLLTFTYNTLSCL